LLEHADDDWNEEEIMTRPRTTASRMIPRKLIQQGIDLSKSNVTDFLCDSKLIIAEGRLNHAYVLVEFAIEEVGKIVMLKEALGLSTNDPVEVIEKVFTSHKEKANKAWTFLDPKYRTIYDEGVFDEGIFDPDIFQTNTTASHETRLQAAFVDFNGTQWLLGRDIKKNLLEDLVTHIEDSVKKI